MLSTWMPRAAGWRRIAVGLTLTLAALAVSVGPARAQAAAAPQAAPQAAPAPAQAAPPVSRVFTGDVGYIMNVVKGDKVAEFEALIAKVKDALAKSENPVRKAQAVGWRVLKTPEARPDGTVLYVFLIEPVVKDADYTMSKILYEAFPAEQLAIYDSIKSCLATIQYLNFQAVGGMGK
jgi:hypothetical protein